MLSESVFGLSKCFNPRPPLGRPQPNRLPFTIATFAAFQSAAAHPAAATYQLDTGGEVKNDTYSELEWLRSRA